MLMLVLCTGLVMAFHTLYSFMITRAELVTEQLQRSNDALERLAFSVAGPLWSFDRKQVRELALYELRTQELLAVQITLPDGTSFFGLQKAGGNVSQQMVDILGTIPQAPSGGQQTLRREILFQGKPIGELTLLVSDNLIRSQLQTLLGRQAVQGLLVLSLLTLLTYLGLHYLLLIPLQNLHETTLAFTAGDLSRRSAVKGCNELGVLSQVLNRMAAQLDESFANLNLLHTAVEQSANSVIITDANGLIEYVNPGFSTATGYSADEVIGKTPSFLKSDLHPPHFYARLWETITSGTPWQGEICNRTKTGSLFWELCNITPVRNEKMVITHFVGIKEDITSRKQQEEQLLWLVNHDPLTGLNNRYYLEGSLAFTLDVLARDKEHHYLPVLMMNIDNLKFVNNTFGHEVGDMLLREVADRLRTVAGQDCLIARFMGDDFVLVPPASIVPEVGMQLAERLRSSMSHFFQAGGTEVMLTVSIGLVTWPQDGDTTSILLRNAHAAMHEAKQQGRNFINGYTHAAHQWAQYRMKLETRLHSALQQSEFSLRYQPQICAANNKPFGMEALLRWEPPEMPPVPPIDFIHILEETGLIVQVGRWVLQEACQQAVLWQQQGLPLLRLSVNISAVQFHRGDLDRTVQTVLQETGLDPELLCLELTESMLMHDLAAVRDRLDSLRNLGIKLSLDDFGTGYSSLSYLSRLPVHELKVDQSFVHRLHLSSSDTALVNTIIMMGQELGLSLIAEGVETEHQREYLISRGCEAMQGYLFSHPLRAGEFEQFVLKSTTTKESR